MLDVDLSPLLDVQSYEGFGISSLRGAIGYLAQCLLWICVALSVRAVTQGSTLYTLTVGVDGGRLNEETSY